MYYNFYGQYATEGNKFIAAAVTEIFRRAAPVVGHHLKNIWAVAMENLGGYVDSEYPGAAKVAENKRKDLEENGYLIPLASAVIIPAREPEYMGDCSLLGREVQAMPSSSKSTPYKTTMTSNEYAKLRFEM